MTVSTATAAKPLILAVLAVSLGAGFAGCAPTLGQSASGQGASGRSASGMGPSGMERTEATPRACFLTQTVTNFRNDRSTTVYVKAGRNEVYRISSGGCPDLESAVSLAISPSTGIGGSRICVGDRVDLNASGGSQRMGPCRASVDARLTEAEIAALPGRLRP